MANEGVNLLARVLQGRMKDLDDTPPILDFGTIQTDMSLLTDRFPIPIPPTDYMVCRSISMNKSAVFTSTWYDGSHPHGESGQHPHGSSGKHPHGKSGEHPHGESGEHPHGESGDHEHIEDRTEIFPPEEIIIGGKHEHPDTEGAHNHPETEGAHEHPDTEGEHEHPQTEGKHTHIRFVLSGYNRTQIDML